MTIMVMKDTEIDYLYDIPERNTPLPWGSVAVRPKVREFSEHNGFGYAGNDERQNRLHVWSPQRTESAPTASGTRNKT